MFRRLLVVAAFVSVIVPSVAQAQSLSDTSSVNLSAAISNTFAQPARAAEEQFSSQLVLPRASLKTSSEFPARSMMTSLYATTAAMQMMDVHSTLMLSLIHI